MPRRPTRCTAAFIERAKSLFPPGGTAEGNPGYERFEAGPLAGARFQFSTGFDRLPYAVDETVSTLRFVMSASVPLFPAMIFFGVLTTEGVIELVDVQIDEDYWLLLDSDPGDGPF